MSRTLLALTALSSLALAACGGGGGGTVTIDCQSFCAEIVRCDPTETQAHCEVTCAQMSGAFRAEVGARVEACAVEACDVQETCLSAALTNCGGDYTGLLEVVCQKRVTCGESTDVSDCVAESLADGSADALACLNEPTLAALEGCSRDAACATFDTDFPACLEQRTGISF